MRLAGQEKFGFYETPLEMVELITKHISLGYYSSPGTIFDPTCGEGRAIHLLAEILDKAETSTSKKEAEEKWLCYGIEIDDQRAAEAKKLIGKTHVIHAPYQDVHVEGQYDILYLNPPYDHDVVNGGRMEHVFLRWTLRNLSENGTLIFIVPEEFWGTGKYAAETKKILLANGMGSVKAFRFTAEFYEAFRQIVIFAKKYGYGYVNDDQLGIIGDLGYVPKTGRPPYDYPDPRYSIDHRSSAREKLGFAKKLQGAYESPIFVTNPTHPSLVALMGPPQGQGSDLTPLMGLQVTNAVLLACSGLLNNTTIGNLVVKGGTFVRGEKTEETVNDNGTKEWKIVQKTPVMFTVLDTETNLIESFNEIEHKERYEQFLIENAQTFVNVCMGKYPPHYTSDMRLDFSDIRPPKKLPGREDARGMLPQQEHRASAMVYCMEKATGEKVGTIIADPGSGKTLMSVGATWKYLQRNKLKNTKVVVLIPSSPEDLYTKWLEEIQVILTDHPDVWTAHVTTIREVQEAFARPGIGYIVLREYYAKASSPWLTLSPMKKPKKYNIVNDKGESISKIGYMWHCPKCGVKLHSTEAEALALNFEKETESVANGSAAHSAKGRKQTKCSTVHTEDGDDIVKQGCGEPFWYTTCQTTKNGDKMKPVYPLARYIKDHYAGMFVLIGDEIHKAKSDESAVGYSTGSLISSSKAAIAMTGTYFDGKASGTFPNLYRCTRRVRKLYPYDGKPSFVKKYGVEEIKMRLVPKGGGTTISGYELMEGKPQEAPGLHPSLTELILPTFVFMSKHDMDFDLAPRSEHTLYVPMDTDHKFAYEKYIKSVEKIAKNWLTSYDAKMMKWGRALYSYLMYAQGGLLDRPDVAEECPDPRREDELYKDNPDRLATLDHMPVYIPPEKPEGFLYPKEQALVRMVLREKKRGRKCLVFVHQMIKRDPSPRLVRAMEAHGLKVAVMYAKVKKRVDFVRQAIKDGADIILTNHALVTVGIDIVETPTVIWYSLEKQMSTLTIPQANDRPHRIHQTEPVEIYYFGYNESVQSETAQYVAKKVLVMQRFQGAKTNGLAALETQADIVDDLQAKVDHHKYEQSDVSVDDLPPLEVWREAPRSKPAVIEVKPEYTNGNGHHHNGDSHTTIAIKIDYEKVPVVKKRNGKIAQAEQYAFF